MVKMSTKDRQRLINLLGMMASAHDGEAVAAARMACQFLTQRSLTWDQVLVAATKEPTSGQIVVQFNGDEVMEFAHSYSAPVDMSKLIAQSLYKDYFQSMTPEERIFIKNVLTSKTTTVSERTRVGDIFDRVIKGR